MAISPFSYSNYDRFFGPRVNTSVRTFDFTLYFEDIVLDVIPNAVFLILLPPIIYILLKHQKHQAVGASPSLYAKIATLLAIAFLHLAILAIRTQTQALQTAGSLAAGVSNLVAFLGASLLSYISHFRSIRPSTLLTVYLTFTAVLSIPRIRTFWLIHEGQLSVSTTIPILSSAVQVILLLSLVLECREKRKYVRDAKPQDTPEQYSGFWKRVSFAWLARTFIRGYSTILSVEDLPTLDSRLKSEGILERLELTWSHCNQQAKHSLLRACLSTLWVSLLSGAIPRICLTAFTFAQPLLIDSTTTYVGLQDPDANYGRGLIGAYALVYIGIAVSTATYWYQTFRFLVRLRAGLISMVYKQSLQARKIDMPEITAVTLMGTDIERIVSGFRSIHELWASLVDIGIALWLLEQQVYAACVVPALIAMVFIAITFKISTIASAQQRRWIEKVEQRIKITSSLLSDMRAVQMLGLNKKMESVVQTLRSVEIQTSEVFRKIVICQVFFSNSPTNLAPMATFVVFAIIAAVNQNQTLLTAQAFTAFALIALLTTPLLTFIQAVPSIIQCIGCFDRIQEYCSVPASLSIKPLEFKGVKSAVQATTVVTGQSSSDEISVVELQEDTTHNADRFIAFSGCNFGWKKGEAAVLEDVNLEVTRQACTMIVGSVGSGKSTLLASMLGETLQFTGEVSRCETSIAFCAQQAWLQNTSIRTNITGPMKYEAEWFSTVVRACALEDDLSAMPDGEETNVGSSGNNLSGGQRQRVSLARAVYSRHRSILMDDVFSAMDANTVEHISRCLFGQRGLLRKHGITTILTTNTYKLLPYADSLIVLQDGRVSAAGDPTFLRSSHNFFSRISMRAYDDTDSTHAKDEASVVNTGKASKAAADATDRDPNRRNGDFSVYRYYADAAGHRAVILFLSFMLLWAFCGQFPTVWLKLWSDANERNPNQHLGLYAGVYAMLGIGGTLCMTAACWFLFVTIISNSALRLHNSLLSTTMRAPLRFFSNTDVGELTNRFSQDMELIGMELPLLAINYIGALCSCFVKIVILAAFAEYLGLTIPLVAVVISILQKFYLQTSRQVRLLDIEAKAPVYSHFLETVNGSLTIRAFGWQSGFIERCHSVLNTSQRPVYLLYCIQQWLTFVLDLIVAALAVILVVLAVNLKDRFSPGAVGVSLVTVMTFNTTLMSLIKFWTLLETSIGAVSRVKNFVQTTEKEENLDASEELRPDWPSEGAIVFKDVTASYTSPENPALKNVSLAIQAGERIAICGRSGSGKTSMILSILQMVRTDQGSITIDGEDIASVGSLTVRSRLNVVPQEPFLVPGTIRFNLDPLETVSDEQIMTALDKVGLGTLIRANADGLGAAMDTAAWSTGQRQLLCLARAALRQSTILILDEATSSVDHDTEAIMQEIIDTDFPHQTVLSVLHRLRFIKRYDKVLLLDGGRIVEFDSPAALLSRPSAFADLYRASGHV